MLQGKQKLEGKFFFTEGKQKLKSFFLKVLFKVKKSLNLLYSMKKTKNADPPWRLVVVGCGGGGQPEGGRAPEPLGEPRVGRGEAGVVEARSRAADEPGRGARLAPPAPAPRPSTPLRLTLPLTREVRAKQRLEQLNTGKKYKNKNKST